MRVLGIDPGLNVTGYGILESDGDAIGVIEAGVLRTEAKLPLSDRLAQLAADLEEMIRQFSPDVMAIEELYSHYGHPRTAIIMGHARGVAMLGAAQAGLEVVPYSSTRIKKSLTGHGRAGKEQVQTVIRSTLKLAEFPEPPDAADALAVAMCHIRAVQHGQVVGL
jgi:crossover junction endodeoxyribonuclease RuvC